MKQKNNGAAAPAVLIGGGLGGLSAAIHLRLQGRDVALYEANDRVGGRANVIEDQGFRWDTGPSLLNYPWIFRNLFEAAGKRMEDYVTLLPVDPSVSFQWADGTALSLSSDISRLIENCEQVERGAGPKVMAFMKDAGFKYDLAFEKLVSRNADTPWDWFGKLSLAEAAKLSLWRSLYGELGRFFESRYMREALGAYGMYLGGSPYDLPGFFSILAYGELAYGLWLPKGGIYGLVQGMEKLALELGVEIHTSTRVEKITTNNDRVTGLRLANGETISSAAVVSNVDLPTTDTLLLNGAAGAKQRQKRLAKMRMTPGVLTFYWGIRGKLKNLKHHTIFLPNDYRGAFADLFKNGRIPEQLPFYVSVASETDAKLAPEGDSAVFVLVPTPVISQLGEIDWAEATARVKARVIERLQMHGIDMDASRIVSEQVLTPADWRDQFGLHDGSAFGAAHNLFQVGPFRAKNYAAGLDGMYYVGASTTPGTGMPMVVLGGKLCAERVRQRAH
jgi:phytoene desaturase